MTRQVGERLTVGARRRAIRTLQSLVAAGVPDDEAREQVMQRFDVSGRSARYWLKVAYEEMAREAEVDRRQLVGLALKRRRIAAARALRDGDTRAYLAACDSEARLLGLDAPTKVQHDVIVEKIGDMSRVVVEVVRDFFADRPDERARFVGQLRQRLNAQLAQRQDKLAIEVDAPDGLEAGDDRVVEASDVRADAPTADAAPTAGPASDSPPLA